MKTISVRIYDIEWEGSTIDECDWYCDNCNAYLNAQSSFSGHDRYHTCEECGYENEISADNIRDTGLPSEDYADFSCDEYELNDEIGSYLNFKYDARPENFDFEITNVYDDEEEDNGERYSDDDMELADFCRGGDLFED